jgi:hypothetical protein
MKVHAKMMPSGGRAQINIPYREEPGLTCGAVEVAEVQRVSVICLPCREEHRQARHESGEGAFLRVAKPHRGRLAKACKRAIQGINAMAKEKVSFLEGPGGADRFHAQKVLPGHSTVQSS